MYLGHLSNLVPEPRKPTPEARCVDLFSYSFVFLGLRIQPSNPYKLLFWTGEKMLVFETQANVWSKFYSLQQRYSCWVKTNHNHLYSVFFSTLLLAAYTVKHAYSTSDNSKQAIWPGLLLLRDAIW